ncbi:hypothetical protein G7B40_036050 [Aetokthonos hydrillicola Thurmond2011]|jgi:hypothetical protein|uniref:Uncharacterized protein n=1 Tax=Aetokthonos hydrillicola Thurmond2011 TaxID=2712845 RepID=A0AAP5MDW5_9CYAN|nr:hypothetical protein [Aetokthonos hydrillicola]MBW4586364.1 hypothetical protein [Aetokthonos hydrillicola CCALA 1050]MDR9899929.1 hypothetical protein [Aetokthonos hydrillicola Thurmond2011]
MYEQLIDGVDPVVVEGAMELVSVEVRERIQGFYQSQEWGREAIAIEQTYEPLWLQGLPEPFKLIEQLTERFGS